MSEEIYKKCPKCGTPMIREHIVDNTSVPKFIYACPECREREIDSYPPKGFISSEIPVSRSIRDWLKSLRPSWKPSEEQMKALKECGECKRCIKKLYEDLQKRYGTC